MDTKDIQKIEENFLRAHTAGDKESAAALSAALSIALREMQQGMDNTEGGSEPAFTTSSGYVPLMQDEEQPQESSMGFFNKGMAQVLGAPVDITNLILSQVGLGSEEPFGGSESIRRGMAKIGAPTPEREPETFAEQMMAGSGEAAGFILPAASLARRFQGAKGVAGQLAKGFNRATVNKPIRSIGAELVAGSGVGAGREVAEQNEFGPTGTLVAEMIGGMTPAAATSMIARGPTSMVVKGSKKLGAKAFVPFTTAGAEARAARRLQELTPDPKRSIQKIDEASDIALTPATKSGDEGLLDLEDAVLAGDPARRRKISKRGQESLEELQRSIIGEGDTSSPRRIMELRKKRAKAALDARIERASDEASEALEALGDVLPEDATLIVRGKLEKALAAAKVEEDRLWSRVPENAKAPATETRREFERLSKSLSSAQAEDMPASARRVLGREQLEGEEALNILDASGRPTKIGTKASSRVTIRELDGLYKKLGEEATIARANKEFNKARLAENLREAIMRDMDNVEGGADVIETVKTARAFSKDLNEKFRNGPAGKILGYGREGGSAIDPTLSMEKTIGVGGQTGELARRSISKAVADDPTAMEGMQDYLKGMFVRNAVVDGAVDPNKAKTFILRHKEMLEAFPELKSQLTLAKTTEDVSRRVAKKGDGFRRAIDKPAVGTASKVLNSSVGEEMGRVFGKEAVDPVETMTAVRRAVAKDKTGEAMDGLKSGIASWIFEKGHGFGEVANGQKILNFLKDGNNRKALRKVFSEKEYNRMVRTAELMRKFQKQQLDKREKIKILGDKPAWLLEVASGVMGATFGSKVASSTGRGNIQIPGIFARTARRMTQKLTADKAARMLSDAITDEKLFKALLEYKPGAKGGAVIKANREYEKTLDAWMAGPGLRLVGEEEGEEAQGDEMDSTAVQP